MCEGLLFPPGENVPLYCGIANDLKRRIKEHAAQQLTRRCLLLKSLSTLRLTLLALNNFAYADGQQTIDGYFDTLHVCWQTTNSRHEAEDLEARELCAHPYPLNIQKNRHATLASFIRYVKSKRAAYRQQSLIQISETALSEL
jgi:hypothetical protein